MKFNEETGLAAWEDIGVDIDKYKPEYYTSGSTNLGNLDISYTNLQNLGTLIVNYEPIVYTLEIKHYMNDGAGTYQLLLNATNTFTQVILERGVTISQLCGVSEFKPQGYSANVAFTGDLTVENILAQSPISIYYDQVINERSKNVVVSYYAENDDGEYAFTNATVINVKETEVYQGTMLSEFINLNLYRPNILYYDAGVLQEHSLTETVDNYDDIELNYEVRYPRTNNRVYVEYFLGAYPNWYRYTTETIVTKYQTSYDNEFDLTDLGIEVDKYKRAEYYNGVIVNSEAFTSYDSVLSAGVIQVYYLPISYPIVVNYYKDNDTTNVIATETVQINELMFFNNTLLSDIVDLDTHKPENYQLDLANSYSGDLTLSALTQASPISIMYSEIEADRTKNIIIRYKKELSSTFSTINTSIITVAESQIASGVRLGALIALDAQRPEYYDHGILDGVSATEIVNYDTVGSDYSVIYMATSYSLPVRYYTDDIDEANWIGSDIINYRVIDFTTATTLYTLGVNVNQFKPVYGDNGVIQYNGPVTFGALQELSSINIVYDTIEEPDDEEIDYPHRFLFLQHNDLGPFEHLHPTWTLNHAYINTGVTCDDIGKLGIVIDVAPEDDHANISSVNYRTSFLFGSRSIYGDCYLGLFNASQYISSDAEMAYDLYNMTNMAGQTPLIRLYPSGSTDIQADQELYPWKKNGNSGDWELKGYAAVGSGGYIKHNFLNTYVMSHMGKYTPMQMWLQGQSLTPLVLREYGTQDFDNVVVINNTDYNDEAARYYDSYYINELTGAVEGQGNSINTRIYGSAFITLRNTFPLLIEAIPIYYPIYLFACNEEGNYRGGLAGYGIYSAKFYYNNVLIRDFIPVETYDKIGDQVAPSNCLYDKVSKTFFEDATGKNSFNIRDDERVIDINPEHQIGHLYVNYYRGTTIFKQDIVYFRGNDFDDGWDPYEKLNVDENQPRYFGQGVIQNLNEISFTFQGLRNITISVIYPALDQNITVNYYTEENGVRQLLASEDLTINESTFYQSPTFGDIIRLNKYKPTGYETNFEFAGNKVTLNQMVINSPYDIVYTPIDGELTYYTTTIVYKKKVFGVRNYEEIGRTTITLDNTDFKDGEYIDFYINLNLMKPENYYLDGESYGWYLMDERLSNSSDLKETYEIHYMPAVLYKDINYYTDDWDEANLIASTSWSYQIDDFDPEERFYLIDLLDNEYTNKYRPANCDGGILQNSDVSLDFEDLVTLEEIAFVYDSVEEPNDPESAMYEQKVLYFGNLWDDKLTVTSKDLLHDVESYNGIGIGAYIPYIDLGYKPKDLKRLRVELQGFARPYGLNDSWINSYSKLDFSYSYFFGYYGPPEYELTTALRDQVVFKNPLKANKYSQINETSIGSKGCFAIRPRLPEPDGWVYSADGPQTLDGQLYHPAGNVMGQVYEPKYTIPGIRAEYRFGYSYDTDIDYNVFEAYKTYIMEYSDKYSTNTDDNILTDGYQMTTRDTNRSTGIANPFTVIMDGYHNYMSIYDYRWNNYPETWQITNLDRDIFEDLEQPQGSLTLFRTTNPTTGKVNIMPWDFSSYHQTNTIMGGYGTALAYQAIQVNPYNISFNEDFTISIQSWVSTSSNSNFITNAAGNVVYTGDWNAAKRSVTMDITLRYMEFEFPTFPQITSAAIWGLKIYDRDRLVRWLVPVAEGDVIYDYTMPSNGLFDLVTEIFFTNANKGGHYILEKNGLRYKDLVVTADEVWPLHCIPDPIVYGKITTNYYDYDNSFIDHQFVNVPTWFDRRNTTFEDILKFNDFKPDNYRLDGWLDIDTDLSFETIKLSEIFEMGTANVYYRLRTYTKTITYYRSNSRIGTRDIFYSEQDIQNATTLADLGVDVDEFYDPQFAHGRLVFNESIIADDDIATFIDAPSPIVIYDKLTAQEAPNLFYVEYYRGGAYDNGLITLDANDNNYLDCNLTAKVLNPNGAIKYDNHYHSALYEDEERDYFIPYQVHVDNHYTGIHNGPGRMYKTLANIVVEDTYTIIQERNGWGKLREYHNGWILLNQTTPITGPGQNPEYDVAGSDVATIPFASEITVTKLTIDRLWAWVPAVESWVKTEDISYDQSGKLYNALAIEVIDLSEIAWADPQLTFADIVDVNKYKLRFHDNSLYTYTGIMSQGAFELLHSLEIVYPETIYAYTCIYYKDNKAAANELGRSAFSCTISDWNPDWDTFISTSWQVDENEDPINPTLYRDTPITLNWDYFGFDRNAFKPTGYYDGIYLWNPRTWDKDNIKFTFDELIRCGTQYVIYPCFKPDMFKIWIQKNYLGQYARESYNNTLQQTFRRLTPLNNNGIQVNLSAENGPSSFYNYKTDQDKMCYDIYVSGEFKKDLTYKMPVETVDGPWPTVSDFPDNWDHTRGWHSKASSRQGTYMQSLNRTFSGIDSIFPQIEEGDSFIINISNHREYPTEVYGFGGVVTQKDFTYYTTTGYNASDWVKIEDNTNLSTFGLLSDSGNTYGLQPSETLRTKIYPGWFSQMYQHVLSGVIYDVISYYNFEMIHYWIPVPKGMWYRYNGEDLRIPDNGLFDLLTGEFERSYRTSDGALGRLNGDGTVSQAEILGTAVDGNDYIYYRDRQIINAYNYFVDWSFTQTTLDNLIVIGKDPMPYGVNYTQTYTYPDILSPQLYASALSSGVVLPVTKYTNDSENNVVGEWYYSCGRWFDATCFELYEGAFDKVNLTADYKTVVLLGSENELSGSYYIFRYKKDPTSATSSGGLGSSTGYIVKTVYYRYSDNGTDYYFDGQNWFLASYTDQNHTPLNKTYAIAYDTIEYSIPVADDQYRVGKYLPGDRVYIPYVATQQPVWGWTGSGWIGLESNVSEVI